MGSGPRDRSAAERLHAVRAGSLRRQRAAGENVRIADRSADPALAELRQDFWLFDAETNHPVAVLMRYDAEGHWLGWDISEEPDVVQRCRGQRDMALTYSVPLSEFKDRLES